MELTHEQKMLDRPWAAWHAMARHKLDFEAFRRKKLRSFEVVSAYDTARRLRDEAKRLTAVGHDASAVLATLRQAMGRVEEARARGDVDPIVTKATHERLNDGPLARDFDNHDVMRAILDDRIRRDTHMTFLQQSRWISWGSVLTSVAFAWAGLGWSVAHTEGIRQAYRDALISYQGGEPMTLRQKAHAVGEATTGFVDRQKQKFNERLDARKSASAQKESDLLDSIRRKRGE